MNSLLSNVPVSVLATANQTLHATLHEMTGYVLFNHSSGFFARAETRWYHQHNSGYTPALKGDDFFQENLFVGYRFAHRRAEMVLGLRNLTAQDYRLNPLTAYEELPRKRVFEAKFSFSF